MRAPSTPHLPSTNGTIPPNLPSRLAQIPLLRTLDVKTLIELAQVVTLKEIAKRETVLTKGTPGEYLLFLLEGKLQVVDFTETGREVGLNFLNPGDYFGEMSVIDNSPRSASVIAISPSCIALIPKEHALKLFFNSPIIAEHLLRSMAHRLRMASSLQSLLSIQSAHLRVLALLEMLGIPTEAGTVTVQPVPTQQEIAIMINTTRESVSRALQALSKKGIIEKIENKIIVKNTKTRSHSQ